MSNDHWFRSREHGPYTVCHLAFSRFCPPLSMEMNRGLLINGVGLTAVHRIKEHLL